MTDSVPTETAKGRDEHRAYSLDMIGLLRAAASSNSVEGPMGKALNVIRTAIDREAKYMAPGRHACMVRGRVISVPDMVNVANGILTHAGLTSLLIAYPGAECQLPEHCCAVNDNRRGAYRPRQPFDLIGGA